MSDAGKEPERPLAGDAPRRRARTAQRAARHALGPAALLVAVALLTGAAGAQAGPDVSGTFEVRYAAAVGYSSISPLPGMTPLRQPDASLLLGAHAELRAGWGPVQATVRLDPAMLVPAGASRPTWEPGLTEAFALLRRGPIDASVGLERLPLETARLTVPFELDPVADDGTRRGLWGARVSAYLGSLRLRGAGFVRPPGLGGSGGVRLADLGGAVSARLDLTAAQLEAHAVYAGVPAFGVGASGTVGSTVVYGEAWLLGSPWRGRGALGASGYLGDALWTLEAAFAPPTSAPGLDAAPRLAASVDLPLEAGDSLRIAADLGLVDGLATLGQRRLQVSAGALWETGDGATTLRLGPAVTVGGTGVRAVLQAQLEAATGF